MLKFGSFESKSRQGGLRPSLSLRNAVMAAAGVCIGLSSAAMAGYSTITGNPLDPTSQVSVISHVYGGTFTALPDGVDYSNGTLSAIRVSDTLPASGNTANPGPNGTDQLWQTFATAANAKAVFAENKLTFGYIDGSTPGGTYHSLFNVTEATAGNGYSATGDGSVPNPSGKTFQFGASATTISNGTGIVSSLPSANTDGQDHMVTYQIDGLNDNFTTWLLFFDDYGDDGHDPDFDYQDLVVQLKSIPATSSVPEPGTLMLSAGAGMLLLRRWRAKA